MANRRIRESRSVEHYQDRLRRLSRFTFVGERPTVPQPSMTDAVTRLLESDPDYQPVREKVNWIKEGF